MKPFMAEKSRNAFFVGEYQFQSSVYLLTDCGLFLQGIIQKLIKKNSIIFRTFITNRTGYIYLQACRLTAVIVPSCRSQNRCLKNDFSQRLRETENWTPLNCVIFYFIVPSVIES